jgi:HNH endonuclease
MTARWPLIVDHIDHDRTNNKWENLRDVTAEQNPQNRSLHSNNRSGACGVHYQRDAGYVAALAGRYLGAFGEQFDEAVAARQAAQIVAGFSATHGAPRGGAYA